MTVRTESAADPFDLQPRTLSFRDAFEQLISNLLFLSVKKTVNSRVVPQAPLLCTLSQTEGTSDETASRRTNSRA